MRRNFPFNFLICHANNANHNKYISYLDFRLEKKNWNFNNGLKIGVTRELKLKE